MAGERRKHTKLGAYQDDADIVRALAVTYGITQHELVHHMIEFWEKNGMRIEVIPTTVKVHPAEEWGTG